MIASSSSPSPLSLSKSPFFSVYSILEIIHRCPLFDNQIESKKSSPTSIRCKSRRSALQHLCADSLASPSLFSFEDGSGRTVLTWRRKCC